ncbi:TPA: sugar ABC transporter ATP-binding protein, partial [Neisseria gonorrhoeae]
CVETPPGTRYNPPFNISENLFFLTGQTDIRSRK